MAGISDARVEALKAKLNSIAQDINLIPSRGSRGGGLSTEEASKCVANLYRELEAIPERYGAHPQDVLGQHMCCNVLILVLNRIVKPALTAYCQSTASRVQAPPSTATPPPRSFVQATQRLRQDIIRPFRMLLQLLHRNLPAEPAAIGCPRTSKEAGGDGDGFTVTPTSRSDAVATRSLLPQREAITPVVVFPSTLPLLWKRAAPLLALWQHLLEVLQSEVLISAVGSEYCHMLMELLRWQGYSVQLNSAELVELCDRLLTLLEHVTYDGDHSLGRSSRTTSYPTTTCVADGQHLSGFSVDDGSLFAQVLGRLFDLPQAASAFTEEEGTSSTAAAPPPHSANSPLYKKRMVSHVTARIQRLVHDRVLRPTQALRLEAHCLTALTKLMRCIQHDFPQVALTPIDMVKHLCDFFLLPLTFRKELFRIATLEFLTAALSLCFSSVLGSQVPLDTAATERCTGTVHVSIGESAKESDVAPDAVRLLHDTVLPFALHVFSQPRHDFSFVSRRELHVHPCTPLQEVFDFGAVVVYLATATAKDYAGIKRVLLQPTEPRVAPPARERRCTPPKTKTMPGDQPGEKNGAGGNGRKRGRSPSPASADGTPVDEERCAASDAVGRMLRSAFFVGAAAEVAFSGGDTETEAAVVSEITNDAPLFLLHLVAQPCTTLRFSASCCDELAKGVLLPILKALGAQLGGLVLAALTPVAGGCSPAVQQRIFTRLVQLYLSNSSASTGRTEDDPVPREAVYTLLSRLTACALVGRRALPAIDEMAAMPLHVGGGPAAGEKAWCPTTHYQGLLRRMAALLVARERRAQLLLERRGQLHHTLASVFEGSDARLPLQLDAVPPSQLASMVFFLSQYELFRLRSCLSLDGPPGTHQGVQSGANTQQGLEFVCWGLLHGCAFYTVPRQAEGGERNTNYPTARALAAQEASGFLVTLQAMETYAVALCVIHALPCETAGAAASGGARRRDPQHQRWVRCWFDGCVRSIRESLCTPTAAVPAVAVEAAESHWLLLGGRSPAAEEVSVDGATAGGSEAGPYRHVPSVFVQSLATSVRHSLGMFMRRVKLSLQETTLPGREVPVTEDGHGQPTHAVPDDRAAALLAFGGVAGPSRLREHFISPAIAEVDEVALSRQQVCLCVQAVQLMHWLLRLHRLGLWREPGSRLNAASTRPAGGSQTLHRADVDDACGRDEHVLSTSADIFVDADSILHRLSPHGQLYYVVLWLADYLRSRLLRGSLITYAPALRALEELYRDAGLVMLSPAFACAEPRHTLLRMTGSVVRRLHEDGLKGLPAWRPTDATSLDVRAAVLSTLHHSVAVMQWALWSAAQTGVLTMSVDPLLDISAAREDIVRTLQDGGLLSRQEHYASTAVTAVGTSGPDDDLLQPIAVPSSLPDAVPPSSPWADVEKPNHPFLPVTLPLVDTFMNFLCVLRFAFKDRGAERASRSFLRTLFIRFRYAYMPGIFGLMCRPTRYAPGGSMTEAAETASIGMTNPCAFESQFLTLAIDHLLSEAPTGFPLHNPRLQCCMLRAVFHLLPYADGAAAERLGKFSFEYLTRNKASYIVRRHTAHMVWALFHRFNSRAETVLRELLLRCREGILSSNWLSCATSLLALAEASQTAPLLEARIIYILLECWATRGFLFRSLILECLQRMTGRSRLSSADGIQGYARLCTRHIRQLLFWWICKDGHPITAFPVECLGLRSVEDAIAQHWEVFLSLSVIVLHASESAETSTEAELLHQVARVHAEGCRGSSSPQGPFLPEDSGSLTVHILLRGFPTLVAQLAVISAVPTHHPHTCRPEDRIHESADTSGDGALAAAADRALYWLEQMINRADRSLLHACWEHLGSGRRSVLMAEPSWGAEADGNYSALLRCHAANILCACTDLVGDTLPYTPSEVLQRAVSAVAERVLRTVSNGKQSREQNLDAEAEELLCMPKGIHDNPLDAFLLLHHGHYVYALQQHLYRAIVEASEADAAQQPLSYQLLHAERLRQWEYVCCHWLCGQVLMLPQVLLSIVSVGAHLLATAHSESQQHACNVLLYVWPRVTADLAGDVERRRQRIGFSDTMLATAMLALLDVNSTVASSWATLCRSDAGLAIKDWELLRATFTVEASEVGADEESDVVTMNQGSGACVGDDAEVGADLSQAERYRAELLLPLLERTQHVVGAPATLFFRELSRAVDADRGALARCIRRAAGGASSALDQRIATTFSHAASIMLGLAVGRPDPSASGPLETATVAAGTGPYHDVSCSALELLRSLSWCFLDADRKDCLDAVMQRAGGFLLASRPPTSGENSVKVLLSDAYMQYVHCLYRTSFSADAHIATLSAETLSTWLTWGPTTASDPPSMSDSSAAAQEHRDSDRAIMDLLHLTDTMQAGIRAVQCPAGTLSWWGWRQTCAVGTRALGSRTTYPLSLVDELLWQELSVHRSEGSFLPRLVLAAIHQYKLPQRLVGMAAAVPLLEYEAVALSGRSAESSFSAALLPIALCHIMLLKESETQRGLRRVWSARLDRCIIQRAAIFPVTARLLVRTLHACRSVLLSRVRCSGLKGFRPPPPLAGRASAAVSPEVTTEHFDSAVDFPFGQVPPLADMTEVYWLSDIPARHLAQAALQVHEPYAAHSFLELSGESLVKPRGGIPAALMSSGCSRDGVVAGGANFAVDGASVETYSILFPWAKREDFSRRDVRGATTSGRARPSRDQERQEERQLKLTAFQHAMTAIVTQAEALLSWSPSEVPAISRGALDLPEEEEGTVSKRYIPGFHRGRIEETSVLGSALPLRCLFGGGRQEKAPLQVLAEEVQAMLDAGLPQAAMELMLGADVGLASGGERWASDARLRSVAAHAVWRCGLWHTPNLLQGLAAPAGSTFCVGASISPGIVQAILGSLRTAEVSEESAQPPSLHECLLSSMLAVQQRDFDSVSVHLREAEWALCSQLRPLRWSDVATAAEALRDIRDCADALAAAHSGDAAGRPVLLSKPRWLSPASVRGRKDLGHHITRMLVEVRLCLCQLTRQPAWFRAYLLANGDRALRAHCAHTVMGWLTQYQLLSTTDRGGVSDDEQIDLVLLYARTLYALGRTKEAVAALQGCGATPRTDNVITTIFTMPAHVPLAPRVVWQLVNWSHTLQVAPLSQLVRDPFLSKASAADTTGACDFTLARLCHALARDISARLRTHEYHQLRQSIEDSTELHAQLSLQHQKATLGADATAVLKRRLVALKKEIALETSEWRREAQNYALYRCSAMNSYGRYLHRTGPHGEDDIQAAFGFMELWLHSDDDLVKEPLAAKSPDSSDSIVGKALDSIPPAKLLPLLSQLVAQLGSSRDNDRLAQIVERVAMAHPTEAIWPLLALRNGQHFGPSKETNAMHAVDTAKVAAAHRIVQLMTHQHTVPEDGGVKHPVSTLASDAKRLSQAYLELAAHQPSTAESGRAHRINPSFKLVSDVTELSIPPPTLTARSLSTGSGAELPTVVRYHPRFTTPGGINVPKVLRCELSDGCVVRQLLKANDDLRQDALIEQVFDMSNRCFSRDERTAHLSIFSYAVVPLAPTVGVLQWVDHTIPFGEYLTGTGGHSPGDRVGAHERYFPEEPSSHECRRKLHLAPTATKHHTLLAIYAEFTPALHYFLLENFLDSATWLQRQLAYTRSVAASSVVGYIVGLGDRHASNLLLHQKTAQIVHIDLGIAFDQNKLLPIPEMVPFRMTRNVVDGMGVRGTSGGLQKYMEGALSVLRGHRELLLSVLSAFVYDPLARWSVTGALATDTAGAAGKRMDPTEGEGESRPAERQHRRATTAEAQRTLAKVQSKLSGLDGGEQLSVATQTEKLLQVAQNAENLSAMFVGWSPWL